MEFHLNDIVYIIDSRTDATRSCPTCGQSRFENRYVIIQSEISEKMSHISTTEEPQYKYRVRVDDEIQDMTWHEEGKTLFAHLGAAEEQVERLQRGRGV